MAKNLNVTLEGEMVLLRPLELDDENALQKVADDSRLWVYGLQDLRSPEN